MKASYKKFGNVKWNYSRKSRKDNQNTEAKASIKRDTRKQVNQYQLTGE